MFLIYIIASSKATVKPNQIQERGGENGGKRVSKNATYDDKWHNYMKTFKHPNQQPYSPYQIVKRRGG